MAMDKEAAEAHMNALKEKGFEKACVVNRSYKLVASMNGGQPTGWTDSDGTTINENQEMANDWFDLARPQFKFFKIKFNILQRNAPMVTCCKGKDFLVGICTPHEWILAHGRKKVTDDAGVTTGAFANAPAALTAACNAAFNDIQEDME